jgi:hypothetical protein
MHLDCGQTGHCGASCQHTIPPFGRKQESSLFENMHPRHTKIQKVIALRTGQVILEDHVRYPLNESNLYFISELGEPIWEAERPAPDAHFIRVKLDEDGKQLSAYTTGRHACEIDLKTGKLISNIAFK